MLNTFAKTRSTTTVTATCTIASAAGGAVELLADPRERRVHDDVRKREVADAERDHDPPDAVTEEVAEPAGLEVRPEESDADNDARDGARVEEHERQCPPRREARAVRDERGDGNEGGCHRGSDDGDEGAVPDGAREDTVVQRTPV